jgi:hypothetical protein
MHQFGALTGISSGKILLQALQAGNHTDRFGRATSWQFMRKRPANDLARFLRDLEERDEVGATKRSFSFLAQMAEMTASASVGL